MLAFIIILSISKILTIAAGLLSSCWAGTTPSLQNANRAAIDNFIATEGPIALQGVLNNIGATGAKASGAASGVVVGGSSKSNPDCEYWSLHVFIPYPLTGHP